MPTYEFMGCSSPECPHKDGDPDRYFYLEIEYPMGTAPRVGEKTQCPCEGCDGEIVRVASIPQVCVKHSAEIPWNHKDIVTTNINGKDVRMQFIDHPHTKGGGSLVDQAKQMGIRMADTPGLRGARYDEKHGQYVVDVASNVPDPLGMIEREKAKGNVAITKKDVNTPVKRRPKKKKK